jgi:FAD-linked sulfhydryl oxidase
MNAKPMTFANPEVWGSSGWIFLHCIANTYPAQPTRREKKEYKDFFYALIYVLPCRVCRLHYAEYLQSNPIQYHLDSQDSLKKWLFSLHNYVNVRLEKKILKNCEEGDHKIMAYVKKKLNQVFI